MPPAVGENTRSLPSATTRRAAPRPMAPIQHDDRLRSRSVDHRNAPDALDPVALGILADAVRHPLPLSPVGAAQADLDQLMVCQSLVDLLKDGGRKALLAGRDHGLAMVGEGPKAGALAGCQVHGAKYTGYAPRLRGSFAGGNLGRIRQGSG